VVAAGTVVTARRAADRTAGEHGTDRRREHPEQDRRQVVEQRQVRAVVHVEAGHHGHERQAQAQDVNDVAGPAPAAPGPDADRCRADHHCGDDQQVRVLPPAHEGQGHTGAGQDDDGAVVASPGLQVAQARLVRERRGGPCDHRGGARDHVHGQEGEEQRGRRAHVLPQETVRQQVQ